MRTIETTDQRNGYPSNLRYAVTDFETFDEAEQFVRENKGYRLELIIWNEGQQLPYRTGDPVHEPLERTEEDYGCGFGVAPDYTDEDTYMDAVRREAYVSDTQEEFAERLGNLNEIREVQESTKDDGVSLDDYLFVTYRGRLAMTECRYYLYGEVDGLYRAVAAVRQ